MAGSALGPANERWMSPLSPGRAMRTQILLLRWPFSVLHASFLFLLQEPRGSVTRPSQGGEAGPSIPFVFKLGFRQQPLFFLVKWSHGGTGFVDSLVWSGLTHLILVEMSDVAGKWGMEGLPGLRMPVSRWKHGHLKCFYIVSLCLSL